MFTTINYPLTTAPLRKSSILLLTANIAACICSIDLTAVGLFYFTKLSLTRQTFLAKALTSIVEGADRAADTQFNGLSGRFLLKASLIALAITLPYYLRLS